MATIILRDAGSIQSPGSSAKGSPLSNLEVDNNFSNINLTLGVLSNLTTSANANIISAINSITYSVGSSGNVLTSNGIIWSSKAMPASGLSYVVKSSNYTVSNNEGVLANTALGAFTITLPSSPIAGNQVVVADTYGSFGSNNITIARNGSTIANIAEDLICDINGISVQLVYTGSTWNLFAQVGGNVSDISVTPGGSNTHVQFNSSGRLGGTSSFAWDGSSVLAPQVVASNGIFVNNQTINSSYSIPDGYSATSSGPISIAGTANVTLGNNSRWVIL